MKRFLPLPLLALLLVLFAVPTIGQAAPSITPSVAKSPAVPSLAPRDLEDEEEEFGETEEFEIEECEAANGTVEFEEEEFESEAEEEEFELEIEECEEEAQEKPGTVSAPPACLIRQAESSITALPGSDRVQLMVRYLTYKPTTASLGLKLKDGKGSLRLENATEHLGKQGVLHLTTKVSDAVMNRAAKAREFSVALRAPKTPAYCGDMLEQQLQEKHPVGTARVYTQRVD